MLTPLAYFDLIEMFTEPGCAVCNLLHRDVDRLLDSLLYERVNDPDSHRAFRASRGLCNQHGWQLARYRGGSLGVAILYQATLDEVLKIIEQNPAQVAMQSAVPRFLSANAEAAGSLLADRLEPTEPCMACALLADSESDYVQVFSQYVADSRLQDGYRASDGLCLPHFRQALRKIRRADHLQQLTAMQTTIWTSLKAELGEFIDKNDHRRAHEAMGGERDSWQRAIGRMSGEEGMFGIAHS
jgi:hypothetical protein